MPARIAALMEERKKLERDLSDARKKLAMGGGATASNGSRRRAPAGVREVGDVKLMARAVEGIEMKDLKSLADDGKKQLGSGVVAIVGVTGDGKAGVVVGVTSDLTSRYNAVDLARVASDVLGGKGGGGRPDMAQAGGPDGAKAECGALGHRKGDGRRRRRRSMRLADDPLRNIKSAVPHKGAICNVPLIPGFASEGVAARTRELRKSADTGSGDPFRAESG